MEGLSLISFGRLFKENYLLNKREFIPGQVKGDGGKCNEFPFFKLCSMASEECHHIGKIHLKITPHKIWFELFTDLKTSDTRKSRCP